MELQQIYDLLVANLDNGIRDPKNGKMKRMRMPIPKEYGGGIVTGYGYEDTIRNLISRIKEQIKMESNAPSFKESWEAWIAIKEGQKRSPSTIAAYCYIAERYLLPFFNDKRIDQINPDDIQLFFNSIGDKSGSISNQCKSILSGIFDRAARMQQIGQNIMLYKYERSRKKSEKVILQDDDLLSVISDLDKLKDSCDIRDWLYFCFLCFTSLRRGEILGLRWKDICFEDDIIIVRNNVTYPNGLNDPVIRQPKDDSFGSVRLLSELKNRLQPYRKKPADYVIPYSFDEPYKPITKSMFTKMWRRICHEIDLKGATSHSFRSSYATMMNAHCDHVDPKVLQGALRHKTPDLAIKVYTKSNDRKIQIAEEEYDAWLRTELSRHA